MPKRRSMRRSRSRTKRRRSRSRGWLPARRTRQRWLRAVLALPLSVHVVLGAMAIGACWFVSNGVYQVVRKPSELFFPVSGVLHKTPEQTWNAYHRLFERHSTATMTPAFLAALAQIEGSGNPVVRTYWRWSWRTRPYEVYRPASSAVGMYQITDGTFEEARRYCIRNHLVARSGAWNDWDACWFNSLYTRTVPSHAVEMTSAYLDTRVREILARHGIGSATRAQKQELAAIVHLCGTGAGSSHARRGLRLTRGQRCGDHHVQGYLARLAAMQAVFCRLEGTCPAHGGSLARQP